jgi:6-phosphogluconolactonase
LSKKNNMQKTLTIAILLLGSISLLAQARKANHIKTLLVGTYTARGSEGIYVYRFNTQTGAFEHINNTTGIKNPSFLAISPNRKYVYSVNETGNLGGVAAFAFDQASGTLTLLNTSSANGDHPCHMEMNADGRHLAVGNYTGGNLSFFDTEPNGALKSNPQVINHSGSSIVAGRQDAPHVHSTNWAPNQRDLFVADLGTDRIVHYTYNPTTGQLQPGTPAYTQLQAGSGPRHFTFHPNGRWAYVIQELSNQITALSHHAGSLTAIQSISTLPAGYTEKNSTADIHLSPDGRFLYGSNRGHNSIAIYKINQKTGTLSLVGIQPMLGKTPRNFLIDPTGSYLLAAGQESDNIIIFKRNKTTGTLSPTGKHIPVSMPVCLKML